MGKAGELSNWNFTLIKVPTLRGCSRTASQGQILLSAAKLGFFLAPVPVSCSWLTWNMVI